MAMLCLAAIFAFLVGVIIYLADTGNLGFAYAVYDFPYGDKVGHIVLLGLITFPAVLGMIRISSGNPRSIAMRTATVVAVLITVEELSQAFMPSRSLDPLDLLASYFGIGAAAWTAWRLRDYMGRESRLEEPDVRTVAP